MRLSLRVVFLVLAALLTLALSGTASDLKSLVKQLADPNYVKQMGAEVELWSYGPESTPTVVQMMLKDKSPRIRAAAAQALWHIRDRKAIPSLKLALKDKDSKVRAKAKEVLNRFDPPKNARGFGGMPFPPGYKLPAKLTFDQAVKMLKGSDERKREQALADVEFGNDPRLFDLAVSLITDKNRQIAGSAVHILARLKDGRSDQHLLEAWKMNYYEDVPSSLARYPNAAALCLAMIKDSNERHREQAVELLGKIKAQEAVQAIREALNDPSADVRYTAASALGDLGDTASIPLLMKALDDPNEMVSSFAASSLGRLKAAEAFDPLLAIVTSSDYPDDTKQDAAFALGQIGDPRAIPVLITCLRNRNWQVR